MTIVVLGSINMDLCVRTQRLPAPGETLIGRTFFMAGGGKGGNQAVASARLGAQTRIIGRVGADIFGELLLNSLQHYGVDISCVSIDPSLPSGTAVITINQDGENAIIVVPGANSMVGSANDILHIEKILPGAKALLLQLEIPLEAVISAARAGWLHRVPVLLDPAPACPLPSELYPLVDIMTPNQTEASMLTGVPVINQQGAHRAAAILLDRGVRCVVIKMGGQGVYWMDASGGHSVSAIPVEAIDTTAAGDAFNGALAVALAEGRSLGEAIRWGIAAGALAVTKPGAQPAMPDREAILALIAHRSFT